MCYASYLNSYSDLSSLASALGATAAVSGKITTGVLNTNKWIYQIPTGGSYLIPNSGGPVLYFFVINNGTHFSKSNLYLIGDGCNEKLGGDNDQGLTISFTANEGITVTNNNTDAAYCYINLIPIK